MHSMLGTTTWSAPSPKRDGWVPTELIRCILSARDELMKRYEYGPFVLLMSTAWREVLREPYYKPGTIGDTPQATIRDRILQIDLLVSVAHSDRLAGWDISMARVL